MRSSRLGLLGFPWLLAGCEGRLSVLDPAGPGARGIATLWWWMFWGGGAIFVAVLALFLWLLLRPAAGRSVPAHWWILGGGLAFPLPVLIVLTAGALWLGEGAARSQAPIQVHAEAQMWDWRFSYPGTAMADSLNHLHLPAGREVEVVVTSRDVIHSFWIPRLGGKIDAIPGHVNRIVLRADQPGDYGGVCSEYCGLGHAGMTFLATAHADWPQETP